MHWLMAMDVLVRVDVRRVVANKLTKHVQLVGHLASYRRRVIRGHDLVDRHPGILTIRPFTQVDMETEAEARMRITVGSRFNGSGPAHHQAGAGHNTTLM